MADRLFAVYHKGCAPLSGFITSIAAADDRAARDWVARWHAEANGDPDALETRDCGPYESRSMELTPDQARGALQEAFEKKAAALTRT